MALVAALASGATRRHALKGVPMRCWDARQHVSDYLDGALDTETARMVEAHLTTCPTCPPLYAALVGVPDAVGCLRDPDAVIPPQVAERLARLVTSELGPRPTTSTSPAPSGTGVVSGSEDRS